MPEPTLADTVAAMHAMFNKVSEAGARPWHYDRFWFELARHGYSAHDVEIFCLWVAEQNKHREPRYRRVFHIPRMFGDLAEFDANLCVARAWHSNLRGGPTPKEKALEELRPTVDPELEKARLNPARSASEVLGRILRGQP